MGGTKTSLSCHLHQAAFMHGHLSYSLKVTVILILIFFPWEYFYKISGKFCRILGVSWVQHLATVSSIHL